MRYVLTMTTSGRQNCFTRTLASFLLMVEPRPAAVFIYDDGRKTGAKDDAAVLELGRRTSVLVAGERKQKGFCKATGACFAAAAALEGIPWVFHLEDDFEFVRRVDLRDLAHVLQLEPDVKQMALVRNPVNQTEIDAGGLIQARPDAYERMGAAGGTTWLRHRVCFTTNPALFRTSLCREFPWPSERQHCEGHYGNGMLASLPDAWFGMWGAGDAWVQHIGEREGFGY